MLSSDPVPAGSPRSGEREILDDAKITSLMDQSSDRLFLDKGYFGYDKRNPNFSFSIPPNKASNAYKKATQEEKRKMDVFDAKHKRLALGHVERWNREQRRFKVLATSTKFRHADDIFPRILKDCITFRNVRHQSTSEFSQ